MSNLESMVTAVAFIEDHLQENIKVADMAGAMAYSLFHFCRTFNKIVHHAPYDYLIRRRLSESARLLLETEQRITDIAFAFQFNSLETYSRSFKRLFGQLPSDWRRGEIRHAYRIMPRLTPAHLQQRSQPDFVRHELAHQETLPLAGLMSWIDGDEQADTAQLWTHLADKLNEPFQDDCFGLRWLPENKLSAAHFYMAGIKNGPDDRLVMKPVPGGVYGRFQSPGPFPTRQLLFDYIIHTWLPQSNLMLAQPFVLEHYPAQPDFAAPSCWEMFVPVQSAENRAGVD